MENSDSPWRPLKKGKAVRRRSSSSTSCSSYYWYYCCYYYYYCTEDLLSLGLKELPRASTVLQRVGGAAPDGCQPGQHPSVCHLLSGVQAEPAKPWMFTGVWRSCRNLSPALWFYWCWGEGGSPLSIPQRQQGLFCVRYCGSCQCVVKKSRAQFVALHILSEEPQACCGHRQGRTLGKCSNLLIVTNAVSYPLCTR